VTLGPLVWLLPQGARCLRNRPFPGLFLSATPSPSHKCGRLGSFLLRSAPQCAQFLRNRALSGLFLPTAPTPSHKCGRLGSFLLRIAAQCAQFLRNRTLSGLFLSATSPPSHKCGRLGSIFLAPASLGCPFAPKYSFLGLLRPRHLTHCASTPVSALLRPPQPRYPIRPTAMTGRSTDETRHWAALAVLESVK